MTDPIINLFTNIASVMKVSEKAEEESKKKPEYDELMKPKNTGKAINLDVVGNFEDRN